MQVRAVFTDLDGTVLFPDGSYSKRTKDSIKRLHENNIIVAGITGRSYRDAAKIYKQLGFKAPGVFSGGACIVDPATDTTLSQKLINTKTLFEVSTKLAEYCEYISFGSGRLLTSDFSSNFIKGPSLSIWAEARPANIGKVIEVCDHQKSLVAHINSSTQGGLVGVQINNRLADKEHGAMRLMKLLDLSSAQVVVVGNDHNDVPLFRVTDFSISMGSAPEEIKTTTSHSVTDVMHDGFAEAVDRWILID
jgi:hypothetical protein